MTDIPALVKLLHDNKVEFILIGGVAANALGAPRVTNDLDVIYSRSNENLTRLIAALADYKPYPRGAPPGLPFVWDARTLHMGLNFTLTTTLGWLDLLGEVVGGGDYGKLAPHSIKVVLFGEEYLCLGLEKLIEV